MNIDNLEDLKIFYQSAQLQHSTLILLVTFSSCCCICSTCFSNIFFFFKDRIAAKEQRGRGRRLQYCWRTDTENTLQCKQKRFWFSEFYCGGDILIVYCNSSKALACLAGARNIITIHCEHTALQLNKNSHSTTRQTSLQRKKISRSS